MRDTQSEGESNNINNNNNGSWTQQPPQALLERLKDYGQEDAFALWDELSADERSFLVKDIEVISLPSPPPPLPSRSLYISLSESWFVLFQFTSIWRLGRKRVFWNLNVAFFAGGFFRFFSRAKHCINKKNQNLLVLKFPISVLVIEFFFFSAEFRWFCDQISAFPDCFRFFLSRQTVQTQKMTDLEISDFVFLLNFIDLWLNQCFPNWNESILIMKLRTVFIYI